MGLIVKRLPVAGARRTAVEEVLFDSGARSSVIRRDLAERLGHPEKLKTPQRFTVAKEGVSMQATETMVVQVKIDGHFLDASFYVVDDLKRPIIVGSDFMQKWSIALYPRTHRLKVGVDFEEGLELF